MNDKFDELAKGLARSVTRRRALKQFGVGLAGVALASLGLASRVEVGKAHMCGPHGQCPKCYACNFDGYCEFVCY
jgi:hypothetical protein